MIFHSFSKALVISGTSQDYISQVNSTMQRHRFQGLIEIAFYSSMQNSQEVYGLTAWNRFEDYQQSRADLIAQISQSIKVERILYEHHVFKLIWEHQVLTRPMGASSVNQLIFPPAYSQARLDTFARQVRQLRHELVDVRGVWVGQSLTEQNRLLIRTDWGSEQAQLDFLTSNRYKEIQGYYAERGISSEYGSTRLELIMQPGHKEGDTELYHAESGSK